MTTWNISISRSSAGSYELQVRYRGAPGGRHKFTRNLPPDFSDFTVPGGCEAPSRKWRRPPNSVPKDDLPFCAADLETLKEIGSRIHDSVFRTGETPGNEDLTNTFLAVRANADREADGLSLNIDLSEAPELSRIPWEALHLPGDLWLGIDTQTNIVRHLESDHAGKLPSAVEPPIRMLVAVANPDSELEAGSELGDIEKRLGSLLRKNETDYLIETLPCATRVALKDRIEEWKPHIIHFIGHGGFDDDKGLIYLHSGKDPSRRDAIDSATLRDLIRNDRTWLVVLNSCLSAAASRVDPFGGAAQNLIRANVPFVVAMQAPVSDDAAIGFSRSFYAALAQRRSVAAAVTAGRNGIRLLEDASFQAELITPVLYSTGQAEWIAIQEEPEKPASTSIVGKIWADFKKSGVTALVVAVLGLGIAATALLSGRSSEQSFGRAPLPGSAAPGPAAAVEDRSTYLDAPAPPALAPAEPSLDGDLGDTAAVAYAAGAGAPAHGNLDVGAVPEAPPPPRAATATPRAESRERRRLFQQLIGGMSGMLIGGRNSYARAIPHAPPHAAAPPPPYLDALAPDGGPDRPAEEGFTSAEIGLIPPTHPAAAESAAYAAPLRAYGAGGIEVESLAALVGAIVATNWPDPDGPPAATPAQDVRTEIAVAAVGPAPATYPPCSATIVDRCIQPGERRR